MEEIKNYKKGKGMIYFICPKCKNGNYQHLLLEEDKLFILFNCPECGHKEKIEVRNYENCKKCNKIY